MKVEIYSDVACPWCYIGERRFERALAAFACAGDVEVVFRPYQLDPSAPAVAQPMSDYLTKRFGRPVDAMLAQVSGVARGEGITMDWKRALAVNTRTAHRLSQLALLEFGAETQRKLMGLLFEAHFTRGMDVSDHAVLAALAVAAGMDEARVKEYLSSGEGADELQADFDRARAMGITAVPTFVFNGETAVQGGQPASTFLQVLEEVQRRSVASQELAGGVDADACANGSCVVTGD
jgi:predicted DsbA family dithiol-disulfide isomerase